MPRREIIDVAGVMFSETDKAILFGDTADRAKAVWLPKSQVEVEHDGGQDRFVTVTLPEWLAKDKGLI